MVTPEGAPAIPFRGFHEARRILEYELETGNLFRLESYGPEDFNQHLGWLQRTIDELNGSFGEAVNALTADLHGRSAELESGTAISTARLHAAVTVFDALGRTRGRGGAAEFLTQRTYDGRTVFGQMLDEPPESVLTDEYARAAYSQSFRQGWLQYCRPEMDSVHSATNTPEDSLI